MSEIQYKNSLYHASDSKFKYVDRRKKVSITKTKYADTKRIIGRGNGDSTFNPRQTTYASPYYDPVARHERYLAEKASGKVGGSGRGGKGSGRGGKGSGRGGGGKSKAAQNAIAKLTEESELSTEAQREVARRKIEDLQNQLKDKIEELRKKAYDDSQTEDNAAERRGLIQNLKSEIESLQNKTSDEAERISKDLSNWITQERESLARRIAALQGKKYDSNANKVKEQQQKKRDKEVNSRADAIYKSKTKKK